jgi:hypothetical protein
MNLSAKELSELQTVLETLEGLQHVRLSEIAVFDSMDELVGRLVPGHEGSWSFEYGDPNEY